MDERRGLTGLGRLADWRAGWRDRSVRAALRACIRALAANSGATDRWAAGLPSAEMYY